MRFLILILITTNSFFAQNTKITLNKKDSIYYKDEQNTRNKITNDTVIYKHEKSIQHKGFQNLREMGSKGIFQDDDEALYPEKNEHSGLKGPSQFDSRIEIYQLNNHIEWQHHILIAQSSVGIIIEKEMLTKISKDYYQVHTGNKLGTIYNLCSSVPFREQPIIGVGTAFLIEGNRMITANHVFERKINNYAVVFNYQLKQENFASPIIHISDVYFPSKIIHTNEELDVVVFKTQREVLKPSLKIDQSLTYKKGSKVYSIGHPSGLPKKISLNASILNNKNVMFFYTSLDSFQGNSGSPVLDFNTNKVIGVLVSGEKDYNFDGNCYKLNVCSIPKCKGEKVIRIEHILDD